MKINELVKKYNFHDSCIDKFSYNELNNSIVLGLKTTGSLKKEFNKDYIELIFRDIENYKNVANSKMVGEYILNIWKTKGIKNSIEIILDNEDYNIIYFDAKSVDII